MQHDSRYRNSLFYLLVTMFLFVSGSAPVFAADNGLSGAGRMYDKWWVEAGLDAPGGTHPSYPKTGKQTGSGTWRCKECHGWDYLGSKGAYASGSHYTGIAGVQGSSGKPVGEIVEILSNTTHQFNKVMAQKELEKVATFVSKGQVDMDRFINRKTKQAKGKAGSGRGNYVEYCKSCHGTDGRNYNFKEKEGKKEYLGTVANQNPWEALHKLINGHPGASSDREMGMHGGGMGRMHMRMFMPGMRGRINEDQYADLLAYLQSLPKE